MSDLKTILVVEDDADILFAVSACLEAEGYRIHGTENGRVALEYIEREGLPDLILLDMKMPVMDGWRFAELFRAKYDRKVPLVVMTAAASAAARAAEIQADAWIGKPFDFDDLLAILGQRLKEAPAP